MLLVYQKSNAVQFSNKQYQAFNNRNKCKQLIWNIYIGWGNYTSVNWIRPFNYDRYDICFLFQGDLGKRVYGFKVVNLNGTRISLIRSFIRTTVKYITIAIVPIVFIYPFINTHSNTVHDKIAKTKVIKRVV